MEEKLSGIVLGGVNFGENDRILNIFTLEQGVVSAKIKGVKKAGAKLKFASEPFCFAEFIFMKKGTMRTVKNASLLDSFYPVRENIVKYFCAGTVVEFLKRFYKEEMISEQTFFLSVDALKQIAYSEQPKSALVKFLVDALFVAGYGLRTHDCALCEEEISERPFFDYRTGSFYCLECAPDGAREISVHTLSALIKSSVSELLDDDVGTDRALKLLEFYIQNRSEENLKSLKELIKILP
ncbi:MAG: DNA repair protein RecO [Clostridia bacterium]|nr:DNA repair protein RecO [Clostridia bacterium]